MRSSLQFQFTTLPTKIKTFRIYDESSDTLVKSVNISTECTECSVLSDNRLQIRIPTPLPWERGKTYYMQFDKGIAKSPSGCIESVGLSDKTSWTFVTNQFGKSLQTPELNLLYLLVKLVIFYKTLSSILGFIR